jgi:hypothetical protein
MVWCFGGGGDLLSFESFLLLVSNSSASVESILIADRDPEENDAGHKPKLIGVNCVECDCRRKLRVNKDVRENEKTRLKIPNTGIMRKSRLNAALGMVPCPSLCSSPTDNDYIRLHTIPIQACISTSPTPGLSDLTSNDVLTHFIFKNVTTVRVGSPGHFRMYKLQRTHDEGRDGVMR